MKIKEIIITITIGILLYFIQYFISNIVYMVLITIFLVVAVSKIYKIFYNRRLKTLINKNWFNIKSISISEFKEKFKINNNTDWIKLKSYLYLISLFIIWFLLYPMYFFISWSIDWYIFMIIILLLFLIVLFIYRKNKFGFNMFDLLYNDLYEYESFFNNKKYLLLPYSFEDDINHKNSEIRYVECNWWYYMWYIYNK